MLEFYSHEVDGGVLVVTCGPSLTDGRVVPALSRESLYEAIQTRDLPRFAVDLTAMDFLASADIGFLIGLKRRVDGRRGRLVLYRVHPYVMDILRSMKLASFFTVADDLPAAIVELGQAAAG